jgi:hypothetical protein
MADDLHVIATVLQSVQQFLVTFYSPCMHIPVLSRGIELLEDISV